MSPQAHPCSVKLRKHVETILANSAHVRRSRITVTVCNEHVKLSGRVKSFFEKQMAQEEVRDAVVRRGRRRIINETTVA